MTKRYLVQAAIFTVALASGVSAGETRRASLYDRLGGTPAIRAVVDDLLPRILADERINVWFAPAAADPQRAAAYKKNLADFLCQATVGPCKYAGMDMGTAHVGRGITPEAFAAMVDDIRATLDKLKAPEREKQQLIELLAPVKAVVVQR